MVPLVRQEVATLANIQFKEDRAMKHRPVYRGDGWVLAVCTGCRRTNYVEPHGTTADCRCTDGIEHLPVPESQRTNGLMGPFVLVDYQGRLTQS